MTKIIGFLTLNSDWDPSLMFVMVGALGVNVVTYHFIVKRDSPLLTENWSLPKTDAIDTRLIVGAGIFGLGWGLSGLCPGPGMIVFFTSSYFPYWIFGLLVG